MFHSARIKLTAWYLVIIMFVSLVFSTVIYHMLMIELSRFARAQQLRIERRLDVIVPQTGSGPRFRLFSVDDADSSLFDDARSRILIFLVSINAVVFVIAGGLGYFLAGRTLRPIAVMVDEQRRFISDASHELRTPLTSLKTSFEVHLRDPRLTLSEAKKLLKESVADVNRLQSLSDGLLTLAQYQQPKNEAFTTIDLRYVVNQAIQKVAALAETKHIDIAYESKKLSVYGHKERITELFVILLDNAIKYSPEKSRITIEAKRRDGYIAITVRDQGMGISKHDLPHIFDRFYRADSARASTGGDGGYGLGLAIAKQIIDSHNGKISATSAPKKGSAFTVRLPTGKRIT